MDIHEPTATVREAFRFSALLRRPASVPIAEKYAYVEHVMKLLELEELAEAIIGIPGAGLNQEQRKRVTIGVELCSKPDWLLFLDEVRPTLHRHPNLHNANFPNSPRLVSTWWLRTT